MGLALGFAALAPLLIGSVMLSRFDLWPAALTVGVARRAASPDETASAPACSGSRSRRRSTRSCSLPLLAVWVWRRSGRREALVVLGVFAAVVAACFLPFFVLSPHGVWHSITRQTSRPLQIESLGSAVLLVLHQVAGVGRDDEVEPRLAEPGRERAGRAGRGPDASPRLRRVVAVWVWFARGPVDA